MKIIAEIGWNHCGDMELAKQMAKSAADNGATYAKYQTWSVNRLKPGSWDDDGRRQIYEKAELSKENHIELINYCNKILSVVPQMEDAGEKLANQIWETNVGQSVKSNIGHVIAVAGKSRAGMVMFGGK